MVNELRTSEKTYNLTKQTLVMGILNITPDSFSDGGLYFDIDQAVKQAKAMEEEGAHIIDVGGESTRPGHDPVSTDEELARVIPAIEAVKESVRIPISIDTYKAKVAEKAVEAGASIINDVWGALKEPEIADVAARYNVPIVLTHNRTNKEYTSLMDDIKKDLHKSIESAKQAGVKEEFIILDPGIGFAKTQDQNLEVMRNLNQLHELGYPILLGTSRKTFIGTALNLPKDQRMEGTGATVCYGVAQGVQIVRVHEVQPMIRMTRMMDAMLGKGEGNG
ncbi:dihydropteroate synthase [Halobacillus karajensis]|uniref:Dihydropteroate synthase n=1 Tax=Halobacillus karajensis TaxID=195088 RepID=A0A024PBK6_9BACI|nr:dihydropteroate synthase [Halobacillus karajensis]CDQ21801.1 Dihydropteroate synthase [Halobacillus karajensis]CDQ25797.1 Dihydropteroate synthase [Halobacillus karajensis]CDQ29798.1 Dihydropteroate synthase [Halobacillus karajensis]